MAELEKLLTELGRVEQRLQDASRPSADEHLRHIWPLGLTRQPLFDQWHHGENRQLNAGVAENLAQLADALARNDTMGAKRAANEVKRALDKEIDLLRQLEEQETDPHR